MKLSRPRKFVLLGTIFLLVGLSGRASANEAADRAPTLSASPPAPVATPAPSAKKKPEKATVPVATKHNGGPAGSRTMTGGKAVALTFDDGPDPTHTPQILKLLAQHKVRATFCVVGKNAQRHPQLIRQIVAGGHTLCNHTWNHNLKLGKAPAANIKADLARTNAAIRRAAPKAKISYFRAPGGNFTPRLVGVARQLKMTSIYWKVDPRDWEHPKGETRAQHRARVIKKVQKYACNGAIVLSHDYAQPDTIVAYRTLLPWLRKRFTLAPLPA
ncbi:polysaccharide deacetylase family protein [Paractinoplanes rishiriensis]|nr:polysaccharide deacetylase family protein [Actinoplanes rishiriensis]